MVDFQPPFWTHALPIPKGLYVFSGVAAGVSPAVESGILPGGKTLPQSQTPRKIRLRPEIHAFSPGGRMPPSTAGETPATTLNRYMPTALWPRSGARAGTDGAQPRCGRAAWEGL